MKSLGATTASGSALRTLGVLLFCMLLLSGCRTSNNARVPADVPRTVTLTGTVECLPPRGSGPHTTECQFGLKSGGEYYALDLNLLQNVRLGLDTGMTLTIEGTLVPVEQLSSDYWQHYDITGVVQVTRVGEM